MKRAHAEQFSREVEEYRRALLYYAGAREWEEFKARAGRMFDYIESIEFSEIERRFFRIFNPILVLLLFAIGVLLNVDFTRHEELLQIKNLFILAALATSSFELYFYLNYRVYIGLRSANAKRRREVFIRCIEQDFRGFVVQT